jgi:oxalate decarboxylase/phosphoglucose isomerase-like protein (cupin superfamily)
MESFCSSLSETKKVKKPWGYELWIASSGTGSKFAMKEIFINSGHKTSYQFHELKEESAIILSGEGTLFLSEKKIDINKFKSGQYNDSELKDIIKNLQSFKISKGSTMQIKPCYIHSILAVTDIKLIESSTLELDDVFRLFDSTGRGHGKINSEHL